MYIHVINLSLNDGFSFRVAEIVRAHNETTEFNSLKKNNVRCTKLYGI